MSASRRLLYHPEITIQTLIAGVYPFFLLESACRLSCRLLSCRLLFQGALTVGVTVLPLLDGRFDRPSPLSAISRFASGVSPAQIASSNQASAPLRPQPRARMATLGHRVGSSRPRVAPSGRRAASSRGSNGDAHRDTSSLASLTPRLACASPPESATRQRRVSLRSSARTLASSRLSIRRVSFVASCASRPAVTPLNAVRER